MYERFTDRAREVMQLANQEARRLGHEYIGTEHILLGLIKAGCGVAANTLKNLNVDLREIRREIEKVIASGPEMVTMGKLPQTPRAKMVIEFAIGEARNLSHNYVGTEHLLLGLLREEEGVAAQVLMNLGLKLEDVRQEVLNLLGQPLPPQPRPRADCAARRFGLWLHRHSAIRVFAGGLLATLSGALIGVGYLPGGTMNHGALAGAVGFIIALMFLGVAGRCRIRQRNGNSQESGL